MSSPSPLRIGLNAVLTAIDDQRPLALSVAREGGVGLPFGQFDPARHRTFELALREFVEHQTSIPVGYVEQLYTFGDMGRESPQASMADSISSDRIVSVGYLGLATAATNPGEHQAAWHDWYTYFPWEDWRNGPPPCLNDYLLPGLRDWAQVSETAARTARIDANFGLGEFSWEEERSLDRYELIYEAGLVGEAQRDGWDSAVVAPTAEQSGQMMISDHRRILATAIGRLRGKLRYRPVIFRMMADEFTLTALQSAIEAILGFSIHKQNFRRSVEAAGLVKKTGNRIAATGGRPAALYRPTSEALGRFAPGLTLPRRRDTE